MDLFLSKADRFAGTLGGGLKQAIASERHETNFPRLSFIAPVFPKQAARPCPSRL